LLVLYSAGTVQSIEGRSATPTAVAKAVAYVADEFEPGDVVVVESHNDLFTFRCYAEHIGFRMETRCVFSPFRTGHPFEMMALAMNGEDIIDTLQRVPDGFQRMWVASDSPVATAPELVRLSQYRFGDEDSDFYFLALFKPRVSANLDSGADHGASH
jgi:hypothetical protein